MKTKRKIFWAKVAVALAAVPVLIYADANGPDPGLAGVPNEAGTCVLCHGSGKANVNGGSVSIAFPNGQTYTPGQKQHWVVTVADSTAKRWGFEAAARRAASTSTSAGGFTSTDSNTQVVCSNSRFNGAQRTSSGSCSSSAPLMYVEHTLAGTRLGTTGSATFEFDWTPPATDVGAIAVYIAGNAANGNNNDDSGDHIYTASYTLTSAAAASNGPTILTDGVLNGASFAPLIESGSWVTIKGTNFSAVANCDPAGNPQPGCRTWNGADFANGTPTSLDGISVSIAGQPAYVYFVSPTQINVQAPDIGTGTVAVTVTNANGTSNSVSVNADSFSPGFFVAGKYAIATHADGTLVAPAGTFPGSSPAARGETVTLWGTGFGPVSPSVPSGRTSSQSLGANVAYVSAAPTITIGGVPATVVGAALNPSALGLYQIAATVPNSAASGDQPIVALAGGQSSPATILFSVQ